MAPTITQAFEVFIERDQIPENLSILTYTEEEEVQDYFDAEWDEQDVSVTAPTRSASVEAVWSSYTMSDSSSVLGGCTTPTSSAKKTSPRRVCSPLSMSIGETRTLPIVDVMLPLYRPSELGIDLTSIVGDPRGAENTT